MEHHPQGHHQRSCHANSLARRSFSPGVGARDERSSSHSALLLPARAESFSEDNGTLLDEDYEEEERRLLQVIPAACSRRRNVVSLELFVVVYEYMYVCIHSRYY